MKQNIKSIIVCIVSFIAASPLIFSYVHSANGVLPGYIFSDGFESGDFSGWSGTRRSVGETGSINNTYTHQGNCSAQFASDGGEEREYAYCYEKINPASELYARAYFKITSSGIGNVIDTRFSLIVLKAGANRIAFAGWRQTSKGVRWSLLIEDSLGWVTEYSAANTSINRWYCVELHWFEDAVNGHAELFVDGDMVCNVVDKNTTGFGSSSEVDFGIAGTLNCNGTVVYLDSAVISAAYIGLLPSDLWFASVDYLPIDSNGDGYTDGALVRINVDTSDVTANVTVAIKLSESQIWVPQNWTVKNKDVEYGYFSFGRYYESEWLSFKLTLSDAYGNVKDYRFDANAIFLIGTDDPYWYLEDGFENGDFSLWNGVKKTSGETATVTKELAHAGNYSAKFTTNGDGGYESSYCYWNISGGAFWAASAYFNVATSGIKENQDRFSLIAMRNDTDNIFVSAGWRRVNGTVRWSLVIWNGERWSAAFSDATPLTGQWYHVKLVLASWYWNGETTLLVNGVDTCKISMDNTSFGSPHFYQFGLPQTVNCDGTTVYVDEAKAEFDPLEP